MKPITKTHKKWIAAIVLVLLAAGVTCFITMGGLSFAGPEKTVKNLITAMNEQDGELLISCMPPDAQEKMQDRLDAAGGAQAFFEQNYTAMFTTDAPYEDFGENVTLSVSNLVTEKKEMKDGVYNGLDLSGLNVTDVSTVTCVITTKGSLHQVSQDIIVTCIKIGGKWYILDMADITPTVTPTDV